MRVFTSRYSNPALNDGEVTPVQTSRGAPKFPLRYEILYTVEDLMPKGWMLNLEQGRFEREYEKHLDRIGASAIAARLYEIEGEAGKPVCVLCFEDVRDPEKYCHRTVFARWFTAAGHQVDELADPSAVPGKKGDDGQGNLFG